MNVKQSFFKEDGGDRGILVDIVTRYWLDDSWFKPRWGRCLPYISRPARAHPASSKIGTGALFLLESGRSVALTVHSHLALGLKKGQSYTSTPPHSSKLFVLFCLLFVLCRSVYCVCVCVQMCTVLLPSGGYPIAVNKYIIYYTNSWNVTGWTSFRKIVSWELSVILVRVGDHAASGRRRLGRYATTELQNVTLQHTAFSTTQSVLTRKHTL